jgi:hypothetical protein
MTNTKDLKIMSNTTILELAGLTDIADNWKTLIGQGVTELSFPEGAELNLYASILTGAKGTPEETRRLVNAVIAARAKAGTLDDDATAALTAVITAAAVATETAAPKAEPVKRRAGSDTRTRRADW